MPPRTAHNVAAVAVSSVRPSAARSSASPANCLTPATPPAPTSPTRGATRKSRNNDASSALTTVAAGDAADRHADDARVPLALGSVTDRRRHALAREHSVIKHVDVRRAHHGSAVGGDQERGQPVTGRPM